MSRSRAISPRAVFFAVILAFVVWALHLVAIYGVGAVLCAAAPMRRGTVDPELVFVVVATAAALLALVGVLARVAIARPEPSLKMTVFGRRLAAASCVLAMIAVLWQALPAILVPACT
jgi:hypothetical protein